jgi:hypothetical protein
VNVDVALWMVIAAGVPGVVACVVAAWLWLALRRTRSAQKTLLPDGASVALVDRQASLQRTMDRLEEGIRDLESLVERQGEVTERDLRTALRSQGLVRYDAYRDMGGQQSWSIALLDGSRSGAVVTCLHARDHARVYLKELFEGVPSQRLSPEEQRAVAAALGQAPPTPPQAAPVPSATGGTDAPGPGDSVHLGPEDVPGEAGTARAA